MDTVSIRDLVQHQEVEIKTGPFGTQLKASEYVNDGTPVLNVRNLGFSTVNTEKLEMVGDETLEKLSAHKLHTSDIVFGRKGAVERHAFISENEDGWMQGSDCIRLRVKTERINARYLSYYFLTPQHRAFMISMCSHGTTMASLNQKIIEMISIPLPERKVQDQVVAVLSAFDKKVKNNREINDNLQQQAFSVFDNLIVNAENNDCNVSDYAFLNPKRTLSKKQMARSIDMSQLSTSGAFPSGWEMKPFNGGMRFANGDTLLARITPCLENGKTAFIDFLDDGEVAFGSTEYIVLAPKNDTPPEMLYCLARYPAFVDYAVKNMNGSSGRQRVSAETVGQYRLPSFDKHSLLLFKEVVSPMFLKMRYNSLENMRLAELRDALLPKLMSGEIDVSAVQF